MKKFCALFYKISRLLTQFNIAIGVTMSLKHNGILLMTLSGLFFGFMPIMVRWANHAHYSALQVTFCRFVFALIGVGLMVLLGIQKIQVVNKRAVFFRGFFGGLTVFFYFIAIQLTTIATATLLNYTYSIWANVFAVLFLRHRPPKGFALTLLLACAGVWLVLGVGMAGFEGGEWFGVLSGTCAGAGVASIKVARKTDNALTVFGSFSLFGLLTAVLGLCLTPFLGDSFAPLGRWNPIDGKGIWLLMAMGACAMGAQLLFTHGYKYASLAMGTLLSLITPVLAALFGWWILGEPLTPHFVLGTTMVLAACAILGWQENRLGPQADGPKI